jgi:glycosyltransferase involved in cell wall biosynthesis
MKRIISEARGVFADGFDLTKRVEERFGRRCYFLATTRKIPLEPDELNNPFKPNQPEGPYRFLFVGRLEKVKGIDLLLQSMAMLSEEEMNVHLTIAGKGDLEEWMRSFIHRKSREMDHPEGECRWQNLGFPLSPFSSRYHLDPNPFRRSFEALV